MSEKNKDEIFGILKNLSNKYFYSMWFPIILLIIFVILYYVTKISIIILVIVYSVVTICWLKRLIYIPKNKNEKYGIIFVVENGEYNNENIEKIFKKIQFTLQESFKITLFYNNPIRNIIDKNNIKDTIFKKGYHMVFQCFSLVGKEEHENVCSITNKKVTFKTPYTIEDEELIKKLKTDFSYGFRTILKVSDQNSYNDINENADLMSLSIKYFVSIIYLIFGKLEESEKELSTMDFSTLDKNDKIVKYLRRNVVKRYIDIEYIKTRLILNKNEYLNNSNELKKLEAHVEKLKQLAEKDSTLTEIRYIIHDVESKIAFAQKNYAKAKGLLIKMIRKNPKDYAVSLSLAFIDTIMINPNGITMYKKLSKRKDIDKKVIGSCIDFIYASQKNKMHNEELLELCRGIIVYYWENKEEGKIIIRKIINYLPNESMKIRIATMFLK